MSIQLPRPFRLAALAPALALAACATTGGPVQVTRFHLAQPIAPASFVVEDGPRMGPGGPGSAMAPDSIELSTYHDIVAGELTRLGFTRAPDPGAAALVVTVSVDRGARPDPRPHGAAISFGIGGASFGRHSGFGGDIGTTVPVGGSAPHFLIGTRLRVQIRQRTAGTPLWEGRAMTEAPGQSPESSPQAAVEKLAHAMFTGFPGESGRTITVR